MHTLLLASQSQSRHMLLRDAGIPFHTIGHSADESQCDMTGSLYDVVFRIAYTKIEHIHIPETYTGDTAFVLSADTMSVDSHGTMHGKPKDYADAVAKIKAIRDGSTVCTGFCIRKFERDGNTWRIADEHSGVVSAETVFYVPDAWIDQYLTDHPIAMVANGAVAVEGYGLQFLKRLNGSFTTVVGLPLFEIRHALTDLGFYQ